MGQIASASQLRLSYLRWALFTVPVVLLLGILSGLLSGSGYANPWFQLLEKPSFLPPGWVFPVVWTVLYILTGLAFAQILGARGARKRKSAITFFVVQFILNLAWSPIFFAFHQPFAALIVLLLIFVFAVIATIRFAAIRPSAGFLMLPYLAWLIFAALLNFEIHRMNPDASSIVTRPADTQIRL